MSELGQRSWWTRLADGLAGNSAWTRPPTPAVNPVQSSTFTVALRSCRLRVAFDATFHVQWQGAYAAQWALRRDLETFADKLVSQYCVTQLGNAETQLNAELVSMWVPDARTNVRIFSVHVVLGASPESRRAAEAMLEVERQAAVERMRQQAELQRLRYLREDIYSRPAVARSYWLHHHPDALEALLSDKFENIASKFGDVSESRSLVIAKLVEEFLGKLDDGSQRFLVEKLDAVFTSYGRTDLSERLGAPAVTDGPPQ